MKKNCKAMQHGTQRKSSSLWCSSPWISSQLSRCFSQKWSPAGLQSPPTRSQREGCQIWHKECKRFSRPLFLEQCFHNLSQWGEHREEKRKKTRGQMSKETWDQTTKKKTKNTQRRARKTCWGGGRGGGVLRVRWEAEDNHDFLMQDNQLNSLCNISCNNT